MTVNNFTPRCTNPVSLSTPRLVASARLVPLPEAVRAYALWRAVPRSSHSGMLIVVPGSDRQLSWCGGFAGLPQIKVERVSVRIVSFRTPAHVIRHFMWLAALSARGLRNADLALWAQQARHHLPDDLLNDFFGRHGIGPSSVARIFGVTRQTVAKYLRKANG